MVQRVSTVAFEGIEARAVDVQVQVVPGLPNFLIVCTIKFDFFISPRAQ
ncbi:MAG: family ATPase [Tardiphaga sp.]|jgi:magnesium chelatase family protein|nr:family ATPase [Tardiphaga sp.]